MENVEKSGRDDNDAGRHHEHEIHLTILTLSGNFSHHFKPHDTLQQVATATVDHLHLTLPSGQVWELRHGERILNLNETIHQAHLHSGEKLKLAPHEGGGG